MVCFLSWLCAEIFGRSASRARQRVGGDERARAFEQLTAALETYAERPSPFVEAVAVAVATATACVDSTQRDERSLPMQPAMQAFDASDIHPRLVSVFVQVKFVDVTLYSYLVRVERVFVQGGLCLEWWTLLRFGTLSLPLQQADGVEASGPFFASIRAHVYGLLFVRSEWSSELDARTLIVERADDEPCLSMFEALTLHDVSSRGDESVSHAGRRVLTENGVWLNANGEPALMSRTCLPAWSIPGEWFDARLSVSYRCFDGQISQTDRLQVLFFLSRRHVRNVSSFRFCLTC